MPRAGAGAEAGHGESLNAFAATAKAVDVLQATSKASVESRPPETPMASRGGPCVPAVWPVRPPASERFPRSARAVAPGRCGTNGSPSMRRCRLAGALERGSSNWMRRKSACRARASGRRCKFPGACDRPGFARGRFRCSRKTSPRSKRRDSANQRALLGDQAMPAKDQIGGRFAWPGAGVDVPGQAAARLRDDELPAVFCLADDFIAGAED